MGSRTLLVACEYRSGWQNNQLMHRYHRLLQGRMLQLQHLQAQAAPARAAAASQGEVHSGATAQGVLDMCTHLHDCAHEAVADLLKHQCSLHVERSLIKTALSLKHR